MASRKRPLEKRPHGSGTKPTKRGHQWTMQVTLGRRADGKLDRRRVFGSTPEEAMQKARELQVAAAQGMLATHERLTGGLKARGVTLTVTLNDSGTTSFYNLGYGCMERKELLTVEGIRKEYGIGRETAYRLMKRLPHIKVGQVMMMRRSDLEAYLAEAARWRRDIRADDLEAYLEQAAREGRDIRREALAAARAAKNPAGQGGAE